MELHHPIENDLLNIYIHQRAKVLLTVECMVIVGVRCLLVLLKELVDSEMEKWPFVEAK